MPRQTTPKFSLGLQVCRPHKLSGLLRYLAQAAATHQAHFYIVVTNFLDY